MFIDAWSGSGVSVISASIPRPSWKPGHETDNFLAPSFSLNASEAVLFEKLASPEVLLRGRTISFPSGITSPSSCSSSVVKSIV